MRSESLDIVLIVDQKWRDLPGMAALAVWLQDGFGLSTELVPYPLWRYSLLKRRPQAMVVTHMNGPRSRAIADAANKMGTRVVVIQTEGRPGNPEAMEYAVGKGADARGVDLWFTWSETVRNYMLEQDVLRPEKILVGGVHRFDFYCPVLNQLLTPRRVFARRYGLDPERPIVSWATNFTHAKFHLRNQKFLLNDWKALGLLKFPSYSEPLEFARMDFEARESSLVAMRELLRARPQVQVALKPHPHEEHDRYLAYIEESRAEFGPRIAFVVSEYNWDVLNSADVHVHRMCMTGLEAWLLNLPSIDLHLIDYYCMSLHLPGAATEAVAGNDLVQDANALIERVDYYLNGGRLPLEQMAARERYIERWLYKVDGQRCLAHAEALARLIGNRRTIKTATMDIASLRALVQAKVNGSLGRPLHAPLRIWQRSNSGSPDQLRQIDNYVSPEDVRAWKQYAHKVLLPEIKASRQP